MKKLLLLLLFAFAMSCENEDLYVTPNGEDLQTVGIIEEIETGASDIFVVVEESPEFYGGMKAYNKFLKTNLNYPNQAKRMGIEGNVFISFIVNETGELSDFTVARGIGAGCDEEAIRVYMEGPNWTPGIQNGKAVKTRMQARIAFRLHETDVASISTEGIKKQELIEEEVKIIELEVEKGK